VNGSSGPWVPAAAKSTSLKAVLLEPLLKETADQLVQAFIRRSRQADV
jgi:hypothetical protein